MYIFQEENSATFSVGEGDTRSRHAYQQDQSRRACWPVMYRSSRRRMSFQSDALRYTLLFSVTTGDVPWLFFQQERSGWRREQPQRRE